MRRFRLPCPSRFPICRNRFGRRSTWKPFRWFSLPSAILCQFKAARPTRSYDRRSKSLHFHLAIGPITPRLIRHFHRITVAPRPHRRRFHGLTLVKLGRGRIPMGILGPVLRASGRCIMGIVIGTPNGVRSSRTGPASSIGPVGLRMRGHSALSNCLISPSLNHHERPSSRFRTWPTAP